MQAPAESLRQAGAREDHGSWSRMPREIPVIDSADLFATRKEVQIRHAGECYRLLVTKNGKLILNK